jgi:hypothetical protein
VRCPRLLPAGTAMADADPQSSAFAARTAAAVKLESELEAVKADIEEVKASIAQVNLMLVGMPADQQKDYADSMGLAGKEISRAELFKCASRLQDKIDELRLPPASSEPTGASSLPHCRILCSPARYTPSAGVVLPHRLPQPSIPWRPHSGRLCVACSSSSLWPSCSCSARPPSVWQLLLYRLATLATVGAPSMFLLMCARTATRPTRHFALVVRSPSVHVHHLSLCIDGVALSLPHRVRAASHLVHAPRGAADCGRWTLSYLVPTLALAHRRACLAGIACAPLAARI